MSFRLGLRFLSRPPQPSSPILRTRFVRPQKSVFRNWQRRFANTSASETSAASSPSSAVQQTILQRMWTSEIGVRTVHFWAPVMKWAIVLAGVSDMFRPASSLSLTQNLALTATGSIWTRWCLIIKPKNYLYADNSVTSYQIGFDPVNFALAIVGVVQSSRILSYQSTQTDTGSVEKAVEVSKEKEKASAVGVKEDVKQVVATAGR